MLSSGDRIWNMDETKVDAEFGKRVKVFCAASSHHGGYRACNATSGTGRHVTAVIAASASGKVCPPFFIVQGAQVMSAWFEPLSAQSFEGADISITRNLKREGRFPSDGVVICTEKGSMDMHVLQRFIEHVNRFLRKFIADDEHYLLTLDNHGSRKGVEWIEHCINVKCEAVLAPANTSHFLQPCDQQINKRFQKEIRLVRDNLAKHGVVDPKSIRFKLMCAVIAYRKITVDDAVKSFLVTGLFPFNRQFSENFKIPVINLVNSTVDNVEQEDGHFPVAITPESVTVSQARHIVNSTDDASRIIQRLSILLNRTLSTNDILMSHRPVSTTTTESTRASTNVALISGAGAEYITVSKAIEKRRKKLEKEQAENKGPG